jgi:nucleoside-diphosphate-sugar epimerase
VTGATGVIGTAAVRALVSSGHDVVGLARTPDKAVVLHEMGAESSRTGLFDPDGLAEMFTGCDAVCNFATHVPVGYAAAWPGSWREHDRLRTEGVRQVIEAAREAGVRRVVQESVSFIYAGNGDGWITEDSPLGINRATEPASVGESHVQQFRCGSRQGVVLRFGTLVGDDRLTRWLLRSVQQGRPAGIGSPGHWAHLVHSDDLGSAVTAALDAPSGVYNVGAAPVLWDDYVQGLADTVGKESSDFMGPLLRRLAGSRMEPLTRSLRVNSEHFVAQTGWALRRPVFDPSWFDSVSVKSQALQ